MNSAVISGCVNSNTIFKIIHQRKKTAAKYFNSTYLVSFLFDNPISLPWEILISDPTPISIPVP